MIHGDEGNDYIAGGNANYSGYAGNDILYGDAGNDVLDGMGGDNQLYGGSGNDTLSADTGTNLFVGGTGDDYITGGRGNSSYIFAKGDGHDTICADRAIDSTVEQTIKLVDLNPEDITVAQDSDNNLQIHVNGTADQITVDRHFANYANDNFSIEHIEFADGTVWDHQHIDDAAHLVGTA